MNILEIKDLEKLAQKKVPKMFFDYVNSGSWTETTYNENVSDFQKIKLRQRVAIDMSNRTLETKMIGQKVSMPMAIAPTGLTGMQRADGEILAAQAAEEFGGVICITIDPKLRDHELWGCHNNHIQISQHQFGRACLHTDLERSVHSGFKLGVQGTAGRQEMKGDCHNLCGCNQN